jgi:DNA-binding response OmpR family regulator
LRILIIDDEPQVSDAIRLCLELEGHSVETAENGAAGLDLIRERDFELVFTDLSMPGLRGDKVAVAAKEMKPSLPIIMVTAHADTMMGPDGRPLGVDYLLSKPFFLEDLRQAVQKVMDTPARAHPAGASIVP